MPNFFTRSRNEPPSRTLVRYSNLHQVYVVRANNVNTAESTAAVTYVNLTTVGPTVTTRVGASGSVVVSFSCQMHMAVQAGEDFQALMSFAVSGATTIAASDTNSTEARLGRSAGAPVMEIIWEGTMSRSLILSGLNPGLTTFQAKYRTGGIEPRIFSRRFLSVQPI